MNNDHQHHQHHQPMMKNSSTPTTMSMAHHNHHHKSHSMDHSAHEHSNHAMSMVFHFGITDQILFSQWSSSTIPGFIVSWFVIFIVAILYEGLKTIRENLSKQEVCKCSSENGTNATDQSKETSLIPSGRTEKVQRQKNRLLSSSHFIQTFLHVLQMTISYLLMLIAMTFNVYLFSAVILGAGTGYFLFAWKRRNVLDCNDHCH